MMVCALACAEGPPPEAAEAPPAATAAPPAPAPTAAAPRYQLVTNARETMLWILDPATDVIWGAAGTIVTAAGETDLAPTTDEGWAAVVRASALVAETGNLLKMPGRSAGPEWDRAADELIAAGRSALAAAHARDDAALFDAGGALYQACRSCHIRYLPDARRDLP